VAMAVMASRAILRRRVMRLRTAKSCGPDAPLLASSSQGANASRGRRCQPSRSPGRARSKPLKPLRREGRIASAEPVCSCAFL
jgi:hypothetical protein